MPQPYTLQAGGPDLFRNFVIPLPLDCARFVKGVEFRPDNPRIVNHAVISVDPTPASRRLDEADPEPGFDGMIHGAAESLDGHLLGWTPVRMPTMEAESAAWRLERGADLVIQLHMMPKGQPEPVQFQ